MGGKNSKSYLELYCKGVNMSAVVTKTITPPSAPALKRASSDSFGPIRMLTINVAAPIPTLAAYNQHTGTYYTQARILVRLHSRPLQFIDVALPAEGLDAATVAAYIWQHCHSRINEVLQDEGVPPATHLPPAGLPEADHMPSQHARRQFYQHAPFASIIICTRDRIDFLSIHLPHLLTLSYPDYEIIIVDNASRTDAVARLVQHYFANVPNLRYVREERPGLSWARNCGLRHARGELVAFLDDDEWPEKDWLLELAYAFQTAEQVACVTGGVMAAEIETPPQLWIEQFGGFFKGRGINRSVFNLTTHRLDNPLYPYLSSIFGAGANMAFRTDVLRSLGGFDPALGAGTHSGAAEEIDVFFRLLMHGHTLVYEPSSLLHHFHRRSYAALQKQLFTYGTGFTAYLTKTMLSNPGHLVHLVGQIPYVLNYLFGKQSPRNVGKQSGYPKELTLLELRGMLYGPLAYLRSRRQVREIERAVT
jgi:glycosyltransferase involved in cell wall biosynthesis